MGLAKTRGAALQGIAAHIVEIEANVGPGLPGTYIVGLGDSTIKESVDRMKTAVQNCGLTWPKTKVIVNLTPANLPKSGSHLDLGMCVAILSAQEKGAYPILDSTIFIGEVGLDGSVKAVPGVLPQLIAAQEAGLECAVIPVGNAEEAALITGIKVFVANDIAEVFDWMGGKNNLVAAAAVAENRKLVPRLGGEDSGLGDMLDIVGQPEAKFAAEVAAAGGHHFMLIGPPGTGKSLIASRLPTILPPLSAKQQLAVTAVHSVVGKTMDDIVDRPPFIAPHHSVTKAALIGGGNTPHPGAVSLAHHGVLFLDEVSEVSPRVLDSLRMPLEERMIKLVRNKRTVQFPAQFQLVLAANPCRCGAEEVTLCRCTPAVRNRYLSNLSGPLRDRIDIFARTRMRGPIRNADDEESSAVIAERVVEARQRASVRWRGAGLAGFTNADMNSHRMRREFPPTEDAMAYLEVLVGNGDLSQRGIDRCIKVAWTLADLDGSAVPDLGHVARAYELRADPLVENTEEFGSGDRALSLVDSEEAHGSVELADGEVA